MAKTKPGKKLSAGDRAVKMFEEYGEVLLEKVVAAEGNGSAGAQAHALRTVMEFAVAKPTQRLDLAFGGFRIEDVE